MFFGKVLAKVSEIVRIRDLKWSKVYEKIF
ncbi:hypothetical protein LSS_21965 [Leptospira santarosai serovar Shermani str. LT 821]|uniref:Uncharacterized protein n=1 Tax=Leptospira santarosai serovar Shermani str. LT 821 TaxID=758847 RepID=A0A097ESQ6_9LEPT|nr:hypothetical protein LSS_21965 [Leptospira santarosai serovar Shermani str. LT 821]